MMMIVKMKVQPPAVKLSPVMMIVMMPVSPVIVRMMTSLGKIRTELSQNFPAKLPPDRPVSPSQGPDLAQSQGLNLRPSPQPPSPGPPPQMLLQCLQLQDQMFLHEDPPRP